jgi:hypothetical protein
MLTFLARDDSGKTPVDPQKMMLGPCRGGAVRLAPAGEELMIGEGSRPVVKGANVLAPPSVANGRTDARSVDSGDRIAEAPIRLLDLLKADGGPHRATSLEVWRKLVEGITMVVGAAYRAGLGLTVYWWACSP